MNVHIVQPSAWIIAAAGMVWLTLSWPASSTPILLRTAEAKQPTPAFVGAGSCAASACHNANFAHGDRSSEYTHWITRDRHAKAFEILFDERSRAIQKNLGQSTPATNDARCLKCHVTPEWEPAIEVKTPHLRSDGVSCESCHGPAGGWLQHHHLASWRTLSAAEKKRRGMRDTETISGRAQLCATCHVGSPGLEVDHDLIAAGHPRLAFEFTAYHASMPRHWPDVKDRDAGAHRRGRADFEARAWVIGQLASAHAALQLLADRAGDRKNSWPDFARQDCAACHHTLRVPSVWQPRPGKIGDARWSEWELALVPRALQACGAEMTVLNEFQAARASGWRDRGKAAAAARIAADSLKRLLDADSPIRDNLGVDFVRGILINETVSTESNRDRAIQAALALRALERSHADRKLPLPGTFRQAITDFTRSVSWSPELDPPTIRRRFP